MSAVLQITPGNRLINPWRPLLQGEAQERALATVQSIAQALSNPLQCALPADLPAEIHGAAAATSLSSGTAGLALFFAYLAQTHGDNDANQQAIHFLEQAMEGVATAPMGPALHGGFTGVSWTVAHLTERLFAPADDDPNATFDDFLCTYVQRTPWPSDYDLIGGLVGIGVYALERLPNPSAAEGLTHIIARLDELAEHNSQGITWRTPPALLPAWQRHHCPNGYYNLGLAHGVPGIIAFLGCAYRAGIATDQIRRLLTGAVTWLLAQQIMTADGPRFSSWVAPDYTPQVARHAWCYGEPGIAAALVSAAHCLQEPTWEAAALTIARRSAACPPDRAEARILGPTLEWGTTFKNGHPLDLCSRDCRDHARWVHVGGLGNGRNGAKNGNHASQRCRCPAAEQHLCCPISTGCGPNREARRLESHE